MSQFETITLLYQQLVNLADEIRSMIEKEEYNELMLKLNYKEALLLKFSTMRKNTVFDQEQQQRIQKIEHVLMEKEGANVRLLESLHSDVAVELKRVNNRLKVNKAYSGQGNREPGSILNTLE